MEEFSDIAKKTRGLVKVIKASPTSTPTTLPIRQENSKGSKTHMEKDFSQTKRSSNQDI